MAWNAGDHLIVRGTGWRVLRATSFTDCEALDLADQQSSDTRTLLLPFDRPRRSASPRLQAVPRKRWAREMSSVLRAIHPYGGLRFFPPAVQLLAYQLEPAIAVLRHGVVRLLIADAVGLGKTVEAGLIVREIALRHHLSRILILSPACVREQWRRELASLFDIAAVSADAGWLRRNTRELPPDVNPWSLPGVYVASMDFVKRAEALSPLEDIRWDLLVVDEAHAATPGSDRRAAIHALACRARAVVLLTATPHSGDDDQFRALCAIGDSGDAAPITVFCRSRADTPLGQSSARSRLLLVRQTSAETRMHRLLEEYTARLWAEAAGDRQSSSELIATVLRKRALSSATSLALSVRRRLDLLGDAPAPPAQLLLPLGEDETDEDAAPDAALAIAAFANPHEERSALLAIAEASESAAGRESKLRALLRFLQRAREPTLVFTEYRDTAEHLSRVLVDAGHRVCAIHGGMSAGERAAALAFFRSGDGVLVATDAASEGLNLHHRCRLVIHFELPWTPVRLEQRRGRVDRIGQTRRVHELAFVAGDTCEQLVLLPLIRRAGRARAFSGSPLVAAVPESRIAGLVLSGLTQIDASPPEQLPVQMRHSDFQEEARVEAGRLLRLLRLQSNRRSGRRPRSRRPIVPIVRASRRWSDLAMDLMLLIEISLRDSRGNCFDEHAYLVGIDLGGMRWPRPRAVLRGHVEHALARLRSTLDAIAARWIADRVEAIGPVRRAAVQSIRTRDSALQQQLHSTARQLVQAGLFDRRALRAAAVRDLRRELFAGEVAAHAAPEYDRDHVDGIYAIRAVIVGGIR